MSENVKQEDDFERMVCNASKEGFGVARDRAAGKDAQAQNLSPTVNVLNAVLAVLIRDTAICELENTAERLVAGALALVATGQAYCILTQIAACRMNALGEDEATAVKNARIILMGAVDDAAQIERSSDTMAGLADYHGNIAGAIDKDLAATRELFANLSSKYKKG